MKKIGNDWDTLLADTFAGASYQQLRGFLKKAYTSGTVYPPMHDIFNALRFTAYENVKAVIVGQDPYIRPGEAHGLSFSVQHGQRIPPSLTNIYKELSTDIGFTHPGHGCLEGWTRQGVLLLNNVLTVEAGKSRSHANKGWEIFTNTVLTLLNQREKPMVFLLWGRDAQTKGQTITNHHHLVLTAAHPSPLAGGKFFGCRHFSKANAFLDAHGLGGVDWQL